MADINSMIQQLNQSGQDVFWQGGASQLSIQCLESLLHTALPASLKWFLANYGGGGVVGEEISGIENDNPTLEHRGTIYGDTLHCRATHAIPNNLIVIYFGDDDVVWCLEVAQCSRDECPIVSFDVYSKKTKPLATDFKEFLESYLKMRISRHESR
jgi:hypothetical protein